MTTEELPRGEDAYPPSGFAGLDEWRAIQRDSYDRGVYDMRTFRTAMTRETLSEVVMSVLSSPDFTAELLIDTILKSEHHNLVDVREIQAQAIEEAAGRLHLIDERMSATEFLMDRADKIRSV